MLVYRLRAVYKSDRLLGSNESFICEFWNIEANCRSWIVSDFYIC